MIKVKPLYSDILSNPTTDNRTLTPSNELPSNSRVQLVFVSIMMTEIVLLIYNKGLSLLGLGSR